MTFREATRCEECPYFTNSKTEVQNANSPEVRLLKTNAKLLSSQAINWSLEKSMTTACSPFRKCQGRPTPWSFSTNVKVDPTPISLFCDESQRLQTQSNCCQLLIEEDFHYEKNEILSGTKWFNLVSTRHWSVHSATN